jgi:hypothetical protein
MENEKELLPIQKLCAWLEEYDRRLLDVHNPDGKKFIKLASECLQLEELCKKNLDAAISGD